jgi:endonuclease/exonuclease/phosphatase (EEP) superfamily protein YafD
MLAVAAACLQDLPGPKICIGDLNTSLWSPFYRDFAEQTKLVNVREGIGLLPSWPTFMYFDWLMIPIDHCLVSDGIRMIMAQLGEPIGSDHLPLDHRTGNQKAKRCYIAKIRIVFPFLSSADRIGFCE